MTRMLVSLKLDPADSALIEKIQRARRSTSPQAAILCVLRDYDRFREQTQTDKVENIEWRRLYFQLAESVTALKFAAEELIADIDLAQTTEAEPSPTNLLHLHRTRHSAL